MNAEMNTEYNSAYFSVFTPSLKKIWTIWPLDLTVPRADCVINKEVSANKTKSKLVLTFSKSAFWNVTLYLNLCLNATIVVVNKKTNRIGQVRVWIAPPVRKEQKSNHGF